MPAEGIVNEARRLGYAAMVVIGLALGTTLPVLAETTTSDALPSCGTVEGDERLLAITAESPAASGIAADVADPEAILGNGGRDCTTCAAMVAVDSVPASAADPDAAVPVDASEWAVPPSQGLPGEPF